VAAPKAWPLRSKPRWAFSSAVRRWLAAHIGLPDTRRTGASRGSGAAAAGRVAAVAGGQADTHRQSESGDDDGTRLEN
jgi:hypothetical protein